MTAADVDNEMGGASPLSAPDIHSGSADERVHSLQRLLDVGPGENRVFIGRRKLGGVGRIFGGEVVAQALVAACKTVPDDRAIHSLHAYFLRGGSENEPTTYRVEADFDGHSFSNRRVIVSQQGQVILNLAASFHIKEQGHHHQVAAPNAPDPDTLIDHQDAVRNFRESGIGGGMYLPFIERLWPIEIRPLSGTSLASIALNKPKLGYWFRAPARVDGPQWMHRAILAFASDLGLLSAAALPHGIKTIRGASIDHSIWFHHDICADDWLLYTIRSPWADQARGLGLGQIFDREGRLVATVAQEGLMRDRATVRP